MKTINIKNTICQCDFIIISENNDILLFNYYGNNKIKRVFNEKIFFDTSIQNDINTINNILAKYNMCCIKTREEENVSFYDIVINGEIVEENKKNNIASAKEKLQTFDYDFMLYNEDNNIFNILKYNNHKRIKKEVGKIIASAKTISFVNILLHKHNLVCYLINECDNIRYYEIISLTEYNKRNKIIEETQTLDLSDLD